MKIFHYSNHKHIHVERHVNGELQKVGHGHAVLCTNLHCHAAQTTEVALSTNFVTQTGQPTNQHLRDSYELYTTIQTSLVRK